MNHAPVRHAAAIGALVLALGCGKSPSPASQAGPDQVIAEFLEAVRTGNDVKAAAMLTPLARQKTDEVEMVVAPPGSDSATFAVGAVKYVGDRAHVSCDWTDLDVDGHPHTDCIVWILRQVPEGWRVAGMATQVFADREPVLLNFEDPQDMLRQQELAEQEIARRERQSPAASKNPTDEPGRSVR